MGETPLRVEFYRLGALTSVTVVSASISGHTMCPRGRPRVVRLVEGYDECRTDAGDVVPGHNDEMTVGRERVGRLPQITCSDSIQDPVGLASSRTGRCSRPAAEHSGDGGARLAVEQFASRPQDFAEGCPLWVRIARSVPQPGIHQTHPGRCRTLALRLVRLGCGGVRENATIGRLGRR